MAEDGRTHDDLAVGPAHRLARIELEEVNPPRRTAEAEHERAIAIYDILEDNCFAPVSDAGAGPAGPFHLYLRAEGRHVRFDIRDETDAELV